ncbi:hypothetical protein CANCADRAFT_361 [Tortispora caseinolytica NRRL Y-17796]|uniref:Nudix hydrolase domain-containing protein n=1 Tax=Tortispora caseinolytica NRRL Y-17796 TaxID=767744 RepID=A0A1E4TJ65_9ASCO|nr:hypothetical protein CANCADRAFT_361 [Tortispora caseinolytica NRRL Y-17796]
MSIWSELPITRRAAVMVLLFRSSQKYHVVLTRRASNMGSFAGHVALPGGKCDPEDGVGDSAAFATAKREAFEEIGIKDGIVPLDLLPPYLSRNLLAVRPALMFLSGARSELDSRGIPVDLKLMLNPDEVESAFSCALDDLLVPDAYPNWYSSKVTNWSGMPNYRMHTFTTPSGYEIWGLTARILLDTARILIGREPAFPVSRTIGDEDLITLLHKRGKLPEKRIVRKDVTLRFDNVLTPDEIARL